MTAQYTEKGKWVTDHLGPINAIMFTTTGILVPALDILSPKFPFGAVALLLAALVAIFVVMRLLKIPRNLQLPNGFILMAIFCTAVFGAGAFANYKSEREGGMLASNIRGIAALQRTLFDIRDGKSDNPRVELSNMGIAWDFNNFASAIKRGDENSIELFLKGRMPVTNQTGSYHISLPKQVVDLKLKNAPRLMELFQQYGVDLNDQSLVARTGISDSSTAPNLYAYAKTQGQDQLADTLERLGVSTAGYPEWKKRQDEEAKSPRGIFPGI